jgi:hypothetical protein
MKHGSKSFWYFFKKVHPVYQENKKYKTKKRPTTEVEGVVRRTGLILSSTLTWNQIDSCCKGIQPKTKRLIPVHMETPSTQTHKCDG